MHWKVKTYQEKMIRCFTAAAIFFCALFPTPGLCDCDDCPYTNSTHSESAEKIHCVPNCCIQIKGTLHSETADIFDDDFCSCDCAKPTVPVLLSRCKSFLLNDLQSLTPFCFALPATTVSEVFGQFLSMTLAYDPPISRLPMRLHLFLTVLLI